MLKLNCIGHLGKLAEKRDVNGKTVINFSIAHTEKYNDKEKTIWVECSYWSDKVGILPYLTKGAQVYVEGQPDVRTYEANGKHGASLTLRVNNIQLLGSKEQRPATSAPAAQTSNTIAQDDFSDLPF